MDGCKQKTALVTGAVGGVGNAIARQLLKDGWKVYATTRHPRQQEDRSVEWLGLDLTREESIERMTRQLAGRMEHLDLLVNNAGMGIGGAVEVLSAQEIRLQMDTNFTGTLFLTQRLLPLLRGGGRIINISSLAAVMPIPFQALYSASKAALEVAMEAMGTEVAPFHIEICCLELGDTKTPFTAHRIMAQGIERDNLYGRRTKRSIEKMQRDEQKGMDPRQVASYVRRLLARRHLPLRTVCGGGNRLLYGMRKMLPAKWAQRMIGRLYGGG